MPGGSGGGIPGNGGWTGLAFWRFFSGRGLAKSQLNRTPAWLQHHAQDAVDAEPGVPEPGVGVVHADREAQRRMTNQPAAAPATPQRML